ncbi:MAG: hypothetical protein AAFV62_14205 [Pseudomonadota bacterium]
MMRILTAILLAGGLGTGADLFVGSQFFNEDLLQNTQALLEKLGVNMGGAVVLPVIFFILRGLFSYITSVALLAVGTAAAAKMYFNVEQDWETLFIQTTVFALVATALYRVLVPNR